LLSALAEWQPLLAFVTPVLVLVSAGIAWRAISKNQDVNRRRATIDLIEKSESSEHYRSILKTFRTHFPDDQTAEQLAPLISPSNTTEKQLRRECQQFLNHYELVSIGVLGGSLHEKTYRNWMMTVFIRDWNRAANYIQRDRWKYDEDAKKWLYEKRSYEGFERLAIKWARKCGLKVTAISQKTSGPPEKAGTLDIAVPRVDPSGEEDATSASSPPTPAKPKKTSRQKRSK
jgi:hypothetical protein